MKKCRKIIIAALFFLMGASSGVYALENEMERLREQSRMERVKEEEIRLLALDLDRVKLEAEKKKVLAEAGGILQQQGASSAAPGGVVMPEISLKNIFIAASRKDAVLEVNGEKVRLMEGEKSGRMVLKEVRMDSVVLVYDGKENVLGLRL
jgi:type II secretory pathway component PulC